MANANNSVWVIAHESSHVDWKPKKFPQPVRLMACKGAGVDTGEGFSTRGRWDNVFFETLAVDAVSRSKNLAEGLCLFSGWQRYSLCRVVMMNGYFKGAAFTLWSHYENIMFEKTVINIHYNCSPPSCMLMLMCFGIQTGLFAQVGVCMCVCVRVDASFHHAF